MRVAYHLARRTLPEHACKFSRHDFTLAQLFACLVVREFFDLSYRRTEALLADSPQWLADVGLRTAPDHNTLWRACDTLLANRRCSRMLDLLAELFAKARLLTLRRKPLAIDSTCFEQRHRSAHYDRRCRRMADEARERPGKWGATVNAARSRRLRRLPKLAIAVDAGWGAAVSDDGSLPRRRGILDLRAEHQLSETVQAGQSITAGQGLRAPEAFASA